ncbi:Putative glucose-methanol-choline oxidoreductase, FAD/NAD(P)-binding domain superfamily [Septoria linicola]|uniref:Glucose-methanol-choline oxidoreductase, FAD/NAD(P)-binding domain superfamily n=1 Tax=Septoria linicola TaxID=215465 RepID=A0A9Q9ECI8_9PEZI|nr:Putative glucose-methanol-choline oxidoreductase, FAD/NAD(P)-binding domain superfamily [Septoria linicola]
MNRDHSMMSRTMIRAVISAAYLYGSSSEALQFQDPAGTNFGIAGENATYDYVIVGGGTAGNALAYRLATSGHFAVAVIEAGTFAHMNNGNRSVVPGYVTRSGPLVDWEFQTMPQTTLANQVQPFPRGKCLGGSSARNLMMYQRPSRGAMQKWADEVDDQSWTIESTLKYYKRNATFTQPSLDLRPENSIPTYDLSVFGDGPLAVSFPEFVLPIASWQMLALDEIGDPRLDSGMQSGTLLGHGYIPATIDSVKRERSSSQTSYLSLAMDSSRVTVYTSSLARKILFDGDKRAVGIDADTSGRSRSSTTGAGAPADIDPQVSGIGPAEILEDLSIPIIKDAPGVGQNLQDHIMLGISFFAQAEAALVYQNDPLKMAEAVAEYNEHRSGFVSASPGALVSFQKLVDVPSLGISFQTQQDLGNVPEDWPDVQVFGWTSYVGENLAAAPPPDQRNYASFLAGLTAPLSRGEVSISTSDMADPPIIDPEWLNHPANQEMAVAALRRMSQLLSTNAMQQIATEGRSFPDASVTSYEDLLTAVRSQAGSFAHAAATNKMGRPSNSMAVIDSKAKVYGVQNLRVVDASAFPFLPPGQPQATVYMLAEKIADDILQAAS